MIDNKKLIDYNLYELNNNTIRTYDINNDYSYDYNSLDNLLNKDVVRKYNFKNHTNEFLITNITKIHYIIFLTVIKNKILILNI